MKDQQKGFLGSFLSKGLKTNQLEVNTDEKTLKPIARLKEPRDLFALPKDKDNDCSQQAPRWPIECQVLEERIKHIPAMPTEPEPFYEQTGKELKPNPVGEENGIVVFNYNPISAVNYEKKKMSDRKRYADSSDSDVSSCESQVSTPEMKSGRKALDKNSHLISKLLTTLEQRSSSNSQEDDDDDDDFDSDNDDLEDCNQPRALRGGADKKAKTNAAQEPSTITQQEIDDIWADKSPEYMSATPNYIREKFGKHIVHHAFSRSAVGGAKFLSNCHPYNPEEYDGLIFESRFESGNLAKAVQITPTYYELYLRPDLYTSRACQWFYFQVKRTKRNMLYRFSIVNLIKSDSLFNDGLRPLMYSTHNAKTKNVGWTRCGDNICYYRNDEDNTSSEDEEDNSFYTLTFNIEFENDNDTVYFAHSYPYTYSDLQDYLMEIQKNPVKSKFCKLRLLCRTLAGNNVYYLTVTTPAATEELNKRKKSVIVSARVHPSETPSSWMMKGLMDFITGESTVAKRLRHKFIFKLIPMLNPDGVIVGNTRNSLAGKDLNRQYRTVIRETYPSIWYTKALIKRLIDECGVSMYCDMHAHSRRHNIFIYGCENRRSHDKKLTEQVFPLMLHKNAADKFSFENCKFKIQRTKEGTGRIVVWMLGITNSYTIEASIGGSLLGSRKGTHFTTQDYEHMGRAFCETLLDYYDENPNKECLRLKIIERLMKEGSTAEDPINIPLSDYSSDENSNPGSDNEGQSSSANRNFSDLEGPCCHPLMAPPCSPETDAEAKKSNRNKLRYKALRRRKKNERSPLDMPTTDPGSEFLFSTDEELMIDATSVTQIYGTMPRTVRRRLLQSELQRRYIEEIGDGVRFMPPELIITSPAKNDGGGPMPSVPMKIAYSKAMGMPKSAMASAKLVELPAIGEPVKRTSSCHNINAIAQSPATATTAAAPSPAAVTPTLWQSTVKRPSPLPTPASAARPVIKTKMIARKEPLSKEDLDIKLSLKKKIWTGIQPDDAAYGVDRSRTLSAAVAPPVPTKPGNKKAQLEANLDTSAKRLEDEKLLTACTQKLIEWQMNTGAVSSPRVQGKVPVETLVPQIDEDRTLRIFKHLTNIKKPIAHKSNADNKVGKTKRNCLTKVAETSTFITRISKTKLRANGQANNSRSTNKTPLAATTGNSNKSQGRGPNKFRTGGIVATAVQPSRNSTAQSNKKPKPATANGSSSKTSDAMTALKITNASGAGDAGTNTTATITTSITTNTAKPVTSGIVIATSAKSMVRKVKTKLKKKKSATNMLSTKDTNNETTLTTLYTNTAMISSSSY